MSSFYHLDPLCCLEDHHHLEEEEHQEEEEHLRRQQPEEHQAVPTNPSDDLRSLLAKQAETHLLCVAAGYPKAEPFLAWARREAADWILRAAGHLGFQPHTAALAVDCLDRFLSGQTRLRERQPWMAQLSAVACLSIAAKVEETHVPLLLDLQVEESRFVFEPRTVQRMELLVLSTLGWRMNSITPISLVDHLVAQMGPVSRHGASRFKSHCHSALLCAISDPRWVEFLPSTLAAAAILHCPDEFFDLAEHRTRFLSLMDTNVEEVADCSRFIAESAAGGGWCSAAGRRRRCWPPSSSSPPPPSSPTGVLGSSFSCESSDDSWEMGCAVIKRQRTGFPGEIES